MPERENCRLRPDRDVVAGADGMTPPVKHAAKVDDIALTQVDFSWL